MGRSLADVHRLVEIRRYQEAASLLSRLSVVHPDDARVWYVFSGVLLELGYRPHALDAAYRAVTVSPDDPRTHIAYSAAVAALGRHSLAVAAAREATRLAPHLPRAWIQLAEAESMRWKGGKRAREAARRAVALAPGDPDTHLTLGVVARRDRAGAERAYREALRLDPGNAAARNNLAILEMRRGRTVSAFRGFRESGASAPWDRVGVSNVNVALLRTLWLSSFLVALLTGVGLALLLALRHTLHVRGMGSVAFPYRLVVLGLLVVLAVSAGRRLLGGIRSQWRHVLRVLRRNPHFAAWALAVACIAPIPLVGLVLGGSQGIEMMTGALCLLFACVQYIGAFSVAIEWLRNR